MDDFELDDDEDDELPPPPDEEDDEDEELGPVDELEELLDELAADERRCRSTAARRRCE